MRVLQFHPAFKTPFELHPTFTWLWGIAQVWRSIRLEERQASRARASLAAGLAPATTRLLDQFDAGVDALDSIVQVRAGDRVRDQIVVGQPRRRGAIREPGD